MYGEIGGGAGGQGLRKNQKRFCLVCSSVSVVEL